MCTLPDSAFSVNVTRPGDQDPDLSYYSAEDVAERYKGCTPEEVAEYTAQDAARVDAFNRGAWDMVGVRVEVSRHGVKLADASLWGIESDSGEDYFAEVERDLTAEALDAARATLAKLCKGD